LGVSDRHYFAWLTAVLTRFERESGELRAIGGSGSADLVVLAGARPNPAFAFLREALGGNRVSVRWLDRFERGPEVEPVDFNALDTMPHAVCDVLMMTRASYMVRDPRAFLSGTRRLLRPGGLMIVDWVHGSAEAPALDLPGVHEYGATTRRFWTTYADSTFLAEYPGEFEAFIRHVNRPPWWVDAGDPGARPSPCRRGTSHRSRGAFLSR